MEQIEWEIVDGLWSVTITGSATRDIWFIIGESLIGGTDVIGY